MNPFVVVQPATTVVPFDFSQPIRTEAPPPPENQVEQAQAAMDQALNAFYNKDFYSAMTLVDKALTGLPHDTAVHEFRALVLFALGKYDQAAEALYAILSVGPGWDWTTMLGLYADRETYSQHLDRLERHVATRPSDAAARFVLGYHYLTLNFPEEAVEQFRKVVELKPSSSLASQMVQLVESSLKGESTDGTSAQPAGSGTAELPEDVGVAPEPSSLWGTWVAKPAEDTTIRLELRDDATFTWTVEQSEAPRSFSGQFTQGGTLLTLAPAEGGAMVGNVSSLQPDRFDFRMAGSSASDPGLQFRRN